LTDRDLNSNHVIRPMNGTVMMGKTKSLPSASANGIRKGK